MSEQMALIGRETPIPDLATFDVILVNSSAGKDSQAMLDYVAELARTAGVMDRVVVLHNNLGKAEWPGTEELAKEQAAHYGFRFIERHRAQQLMEEINQRGMWPDALNRYCTSDQKRGPSWKVITELVADLALARQARVLYCLGLRAEESRGRAKKPALEVNKAASSGVREVTTWLPILHWSEAEVWTRIKASGVRYHWAYDKGMKRLSCSFCVLATREDLMCAARLRPELADEYVALEHRIGDQFRDGATMRGLVAEARGEELDTRDIDHLKLRSEEQRAARKVDRLIRLRQAGKDADLAEIDRQRTIRDAARAKREELEGELPRLAEAVAKAKGGQS